QQDNNTQNNLQYAPVHQPLDPGTFRMGENIVQFG
ncbi:hypothetical protein KKB3_01584, partial [Dehalococcoides mccartyi]